MRKAAMDDHNNTDEERSILPLSCQSSTSRTANARRGPMSIITTPNEEDILCGKEKHCIIHAGTRRYRQFIDAYQQRYRNATNKHDKMEITKEIVLTLGRTARFLRYNKEIKAYEELSHLEARDKTSHALRTACKRISKQQKQMKSISSSSRPAAPRMNLPEFVPSANTTQWQPPTQRSMPRLSRPVAMDPHSRMTSDSHPLPIHSEEKMDGALFADLMTLLKDPEPGFKFSE